MQPLATGIAHRSATHRSRHTRFRDGAFLTGISLLLSALTPTASAQARRDGAGSIENSVVLVVLDDLAVEWLSQYSDLTGGALPPTGVYPNTPALERIAQQGIRFDQAWGSASCSPTRAMIQTGAYPFRIGIGEQIPPLGVPGGNSRRIYPRDLSDPTFTQRHSLARVAHEAGYEAACFGKWHLSGSTASGGPGSIAYDTASEIVDPTKFAFDYFYGHLFGIPTPTQICTWQGYVATPGNVQEIGWPATPSYLLCGTLSACVDPTFGTGWLQTRESPFLCYFAPLAPFELLYRPLNPGQLCNTCGFRLHNVAFATTPAGWKAAPGEESLAYQALVEAADAMVGQILDALDAKLLPEGASWYDQVTVILTGDNGTPTSSYVNFYWPPGRGKDTVYEGGVRVPFFIAGKAVHPSLRGTQCTVPVTAADIYPTVDAIIHAYTAHRSPDGVSLLPLLEGAPFTRSEDWGDIVYTEFFAPNFAPPVDVTVTNKWERAATDGTYKVVQHGKRIGPFWTFSSSYMKLNRGGGSLAEVEIDPVPAHRTLEHFMSQLTGFW